MIDSTLLTDNQVNAITTVCVILANDCSVDTKVVKLPISLQEAADLVVQLGFVGSAYYIRFDKTVLSAALTDKGKTVVATARQAVLNLSLSVKPSFAELRDKTPYVCNKMMFEALNTYVSTWEHFESIYFQHGKLIRLSYNETAEIYERYCQELLQDKLLEQNTFTTLINILERHFGVEEATISKAPIPETPPLEVKTSERALFNILGRLTSRQRQLLLAVRKLNPHNSLHGIDLKALVDTSGSDLGAIYEDLRALKDLGCFCMPRYLMNNNSSSVVIPGTGIGRAITDILRILWTLD